MDLGMKALNLPNFKVQSALFDHKDSIQAAAHDVIRSWSHQQPNKQEAYIALHTGLKETHMHQLAAELKPWFKGTVEETTETLQEGK